MNGKDIARLRMRNLRLWGTPFESPEDVVDWLGAVQSQDFGPAKWSIAERATGLDDAAVQKAFDEGTILRTHVLRPTWHFVLPEDIRWMLELTGPRVRRQMSHYDRLLGLDAAVSRKCTRLIAKALKREGRLTRKELSAVLEKAGIPAKGQRLGHIVINAELDGVICSGGLRGKQHTYAPLDERAPNAKRLGRDAALAELTRRYFTSHGPATAKDIKWWSSLTLAEIKRGLDMIGSGLDQETVGGVTYWFAGDAIPLRSRAPRAHLLQPYDEYIVGYSETRYALDRSGTARSIPNLFGGAILVDGQVAGQYKRTLTKDSVIVEASLFRPLNKTETNELRAAAKRLGEFLGLELELVISEV